MLPSNCTPWLAGAPGAHLPRLGWRPRCQEQPWQRGWGWSEALQATGHPYWREEHGFNSSPAFFHADRRPWCWVAEAERGGWEGTAWLLRPRLCHPGLCPHLGEAGCPGASQTYRLVSVGLVRPLYSGCCPLGPGGHAFSRVGARPHQKAPFPSRWPLSLSPCPHGGPYKSASRAKRGPQSQRQL